MNLTHGKMLSPQRLSSLIVAMACVFGSHLPAETSLVPPDLKTSPALDRSLTYNLGATGMRGWIFTRPATYLDSLQGRTTALSRQILVTHVGDKSPAQGVMQVDDVILGVDGNPFTEDARKSFALAIQQAEKKSNGGVLKLTRWRAGKTAEVQLKLRVMGTYSDMAPFKCPKSLRIFEDACKALEQEPLEDNLWGAINGLALLSTGKSDYLPKLQTFARMIGPPTLKVDLKSPNITWHGSYKNLFLCEYYLLTGDQEVLHAINEYTVALAKGQGMYGTFGHGLSGLTADGKLHGPVPSYGPMNEAGLIANLSIVLGRKCGVNHPEIDPAIERGSRFISYYVDKGSLPYGEHEPWPYHENNGKVSMSSLLFSLQQNRTDETQFFAKMAVAGYKSRECGHTGQGFSYLWSALGANVGGPAALAAFFKEASWHFDLVRRCDGSFTYDGGEQYGPGETDDDTYFGNSTYNGLSPNATYVLTYSIPKKNLCITGKDANQSNWLSPQQVSGAIASGNFDLARTSLTPLELVAAFSDWSPIVRGWAAGELATRPEAKAMVPELIAMTDSKDAHISQGACETLGLLQSAEALPALVRQLSHNDRWVRYKAAQSIKQLDALAKPALPDILKAVALTAEPIQPINWADPIQFAHGQLAAALFANNMANTLQQADPKLLYPAIRILSKNPAGMARANLQKYFETRLTEDEVRLLAPDLLMAIQIMCPADTMFADEIRMGAFKALAKYHFQEAIDAGVWLAKTQSGWHSETRTPEIMARIVEFGTAARGAIPGLKAVIVALNAQVTRGEFPGGEFNSRRIAAITNAIKAIESSTTQPKLRALKSAPPQRVTTH